MWSIIPNLDPLLELIHRPPKPVEARMTTHNTGPQKLGYQHVHHGFVLATEYGIAECPKWVALARKNYAHRKNPSAQPPVSPEDLRAVLEPYQATTDLPSVLFARDLLKLYPDAKVVLNRRKDVSAWKASQIATIGAIYQSTWPNLQRCVNGELFWMSQAAKWCVQAPYDWNVEKNAVKFYEEHYRALEEDMRKEGRIWLDWTVEDGWEPLCGFLEKEVPVGVEFPRGNERSGFDEKRKKLHAKRRADADRKLRLVGGVLMLGLGGLLWKTWGGKLLR